MSSVNAVCYNLVGPAEAALNSLLFSTAACMCNLCTFLIRSSPPPPGRPAQVHSLMIKKTSAVTTTVLGEVKIVGLLLLSAMLLGEGKEFTLKMTVGCLLAMGGFALYRCALAGRLGCTFLRKAAASFCLWVCGGHTFVPCAPSASQPLEDQEASGGHGAAGHQPCAVWQRSRTEAAQGRRRRSAPCRLCCQLCVRQGVRAILRTPQACRSAVQILVSCKPTNLGSITTSVKQFTGHCSVQKAEAKRGVC